MSPLPKSVVNDVVIKLGKAMLEKKMPFAFLVGDLPTYKLIVEIIAENNEHKHIVPILAAFHQQMSYIYAIYKRFKDSGISGMFSRCRCDSGRICRSSIEGKTLPAWPKMHNAVERSTYTEALVQTPRNHHFATEDS